MNDTYTVEQAHEWVNELSTAVELAKGDETSDNPMIRKPAENGITTVGEFAEEAEQHLDAVQQGIEEVDWSGHFREPIYADTITQDCQKLRQELEFVQSNQCVDSEQYTEIKELIRRIRHCAIEVRNAKAVQNN